MASVVLVHGIRTSATMWRAQGRALEAAGIPHRAVDLPGHGTRLGETFTLARSREVLDEAVASLPPPHVVVGLSLGSYVAIDWAASRSRSTAPGPAAMILASCGTRPRGLGLTGYLTIAGLIGRFPDKGLALHTWSARRAVGAAAALDVLDGGVAVDAMVPTLRTLRHLDVPAAIARIECPLWFVNGSRDHLRIEERLLLGAARAGTLIVVPKAGHLVSFDRPAAFTQLIFDLAGEVDLVSSVRRG